MGKEKGPRSVLLRGLLLLGFTDSNVIPKGFGSERVMKPLGIVSAKGGQAANLKGFLARSVCEN